MTSVKRVMPGAALGLVLAAATGFSAQAPFETQVFEIQYVDPEQLQEALILFTDVTTRPVPALNLLSVRARGDVMPAIAQIIERLDVPRQNVQLTIHILGADLPPGVTGSGPIPETIEGVVDQLRDVFSYENFELLETSQVRGVGGDQVYVQGSLPSLSGGPAGSYLLSTAFRVRGQGEGAGVLGLEALEFRTSGTGQSGTIINTSVDVPAGRQVVVGKAAFGDAAIILVMTADFLD